MNREFTVTICDIETGECIKKFEPCKTLIAATRLEDAVIERTDLDKYFVVIENSEGKYS